MNIDEMLRQLVKDLRELVKPALQVISQLEPIGHGTESNDGRSSGGELVALLSQFVQSIVFDGGYSDSSGGTQTGQVERPSYSELVRRNSQIATALGACDCWGERSNCSMCRGAGSPGWISPDSNLFDVYVRPIMHEFSNKAT
jgi:hypothetical protein